MTTQTMVCTQARENNSLLELKTSYCAVSMFNITKAKYYVLHCMRVLSLCINFRRNLQNNLVRK